MSKLVKLTSPDTLIVLTFAKAGLGHLRVAYALMEGLPKGANVVLFSSRDEATTFMHRLSSNNLVFRALAELLQYGLAERIFTALYTRILRQRANGLLPQLEAVVHQQKVKPKKVIVVSTHFGLAHQVGELKTQLESKLGIDLKLVVVVTDDSPQRAWRVPEADLTLVPSKLTHERLEAPRAKVVHYPVSLNLGQNLAPKKLEYKLSQARASSGTKIEVIIPVSGAAVSLDYFSRLIKALTKKDKRFSFHVVSRESTYTKPFLTRMKLLANVHVYAYNYDRLVVANYDRAIRQNTIAYEVTKPSEQAFKALYSPKQIGGVVLLFSHPVGRQEYDNLWYLERNKFIPTKKDGEELWTLAANQKPITKTLLEKAKTWRGLRLPTGSHKSAQFILWLLKEKVFEEMMNFSNKSKSAGVMDVWKEVDRIS